MTRYDLMYEDIPTSDGRLIVPGGITWADGERIPVVDRTGTGDDAAPIVGYVENICREGNRITGEVHITEPLHSTTAVYPQADCDNQVQDEPADPGTMLITQTRLRGITLGHRPAWDLPHIPIPGITNPVRLDPVSHARTTDPTTSHIAAHALSDKTTMMRKLLTAYRDHGPLTSEHAARRAGYLPVDGPWKRVSDLKRNGWIEPTGETRPGESGRLQQVCRITDEGREQLGG